MSDLIELLSDLALLESNISNMDQHYMSQISDLKEDVNKVYTNVISSANLPAASRQNNVYPGDQHQSAMSTSSAGLSNGDHAVRANATQMKRALSETSNCIAPGGGRKKAKGEMDPVNHDIYRLRQENKHFHEIADIINNARPANGKPLDLTGNAVYGRYKRNATLIAAARGEIFKPCQLDKDAGTNLKVITQPVPAGFDDKEDRFLVEAYQYVMENTWLLVSKRLEEKNGLRHDPVDCANRFAYL